MGIPSPPYDMIHDAVYEATSSGRYATDGILSAKISIELARSISIELGFEHLCALDVAERQLNKEDVEKEVALWKQKLWGRLDKEMELDNRKAEAITRTVLSALYIKDGIDAQIGELIVEIAEEAEIPPTALVEILEQNLPNFPNPLRNRESVSVTQRTIIIAIGILDLVRRAILGVYRIGLAFSIAGFIGFLGDWVYEGREFSLINALSFTCLVWFMWATGFLVIYLILRYRHARRALRVYLRCKNTSQVIQVNRALWKRIWEEPLPFIWEEPRLDEQKRRERIALRERWGEQNLRKR